VDLKETRLQKKKQRTRCICRFYFKENRETCMHVAIEVQLLHCLLNFQCFIRRNKGFDCRFWIILLEEQTFFVKKPLQKHVRMDILIVKKPLQKRFYAMYVIK